MRNIRLTLAYDGTNYVGWQVQPNGPTVQAELERAIRKLTGETVRVLSAGRTDSGVHARGQVANFHTGCSIPVDGFRPALENFLPDDVAVRRADEVPADFHATYWALRKRYRYVVLNRRERVPHLRNYALRYTQPLDVDAMQAAANELLGAHDFRCFESEFGRRASSVRTVEEASFRRWEGWPVWDVHRPPAEAGVGDFVTFDIVADGFLYNMVRAIVGTLLHVGRGRWTPADVRRILEARDRAQAGETAAACGLYLMHVDYDEERIRRGMRGEARIAGLGDAGGGSHSPGSTNSTSR